MLKTIKLTIAISSMILIIATLNGCATPANYQAMMVTPTATTQKNPKLKQAIAVVNVSGGKNTNPLWMSQVGNESFKKALEESLSTYGYLSGGNSRYQLEANLLKLKQPIIGLEMDVDSEISYKIVGGGINKQYLIKATGTAKFSDAFVAIERLRIANERSIQENIKEFLNRLNSF